MGKKDDTDVLVTALVAMFEEWEHAIASERQLLAAVDAQLVQRQKQTSKIAASLRRFERRGNAR